ncbi:hypothetical protein Anas_02860 [Armadillidium nasatum]|uniref:MRH domain-containing protein n=1 Tax=Armadillidium nasatum TaxID=96803 RepID=A0A5N5SSK6_9CRUS|nr:hypothetical protein Anas_02860 [Armadillidium nasatum]
MFVDDFHYEFTECDESGGRWRVSVPSGRCVGSHPEPPTRVTDCSVSCDQGYYFNVTQLGCDKCPAGTYSLGGGVHFASWERLPRGFHAHTEAFRSAFTVGRRRGEVDCAQYAQNEQCQSIDDADDAKWPPLTREGQWKTMRVELKTGLNVLHWKTIGIDVRGSTRPVMIKTIQISGVAYTSECSPCPAGTFSSEGARQCQECPAGTYSPIGSDRCLKCDSRTYYAPKGSPKCLKRPPCTSQDYYEIDSACDENNQTRAVYRWVEPQICREDLNEAVPLPSSGELKTCPPCNPGMHFSSGSGCVFCPRDQHSDGVSSCKPCPPSTAPNYGHQYQWWTELPPGMAATCMSAEDAGCSKHKGWQPGGDHVHSGIGHADDAYLVLSLKIAGFKGREGFVNGRPMEVGRISFTFELLCSTECEFVFMEGSARKGVTILQSWTGRQPRQYYSYLVTRNDSYTFSWAFQKVSWEKSYLRSTTSRMFDSDMAKIFNINVTNTIDGGASSCLPCPQGLGGFNCIPCPAGHYIQENTTQCTPCPPNTVVTDPLPYGPKSCLPCGPGLSSLDGLTCSIQCNLTVDDSHYGLSNISNPRIVIGSTLFTSSGTKYFHMFNISLCGDAVVSCANNVSYNLEGEITSVQARACRSTIVPGLEESSRSRMSALATQSVSLGDHLLGVTKNDSMHGIRVIEEFIDSKKEDLHFYYSTPSTTRACPNGRSTTVTLKCAPDKLGKGQISLPHQCPDGTCDGCNFHFLVVKGECLNGKQQVHYIAPESCRPPDSLPQGKTEKCTTQLPFIVEIVTLSALSIAIMLCLLLFCLWKKNKKLEYKYMKLIANTNSKDGLMELPPAESCALDDGEDDEVQFTQKPPRGILNKLLTATSC